MTLPYFLTWDKQKTEKTFKVQSYESCYFLGEDGNKIVDLCSISYHCPLGGRPKPILEKIQAQMNRFCCSSPKAQFELKNNVTMRLLNYMGFGQGKIFYTVSGAESIENALKMARVYTGKNIILARNNSYHGATLGALSITGDWRNHNAPTMSEWTVRIPEPHDDPDLSKTEEIIKKTGSEKIAAFCLETITGGNGVIIPPKSWYEGIRKLCDQYNILLILDEVVGGFHRTGKPFAYNHYNIVPDIVCMAKVITAGILPFGAVWVNKKISESFNEKVLPCGLTNYAYPLGLAALDGVLDIVNDKEFIDSVAQLARAFEIKLKTFESLEHVKEVRSIGLLGAIELDYTESFKKFLDAGLYLQVSGNNIILAPSYIMDEAYLEQSMDKIKGLLS